MWMVASWMPAAPPSSRSVISVLNPLVSAHIRYIRISISDQSHASVPPAPAWIVKKALQWSLGPPSIERNSNALNSASACLAEPLTSSSNSSVSASSASSISRFEVLGLANQLLERLEHGVECLQFRDDPLGFLLIVPEGGAVHLLLESVPMGLFVAEVKESLEAGGSSR